MDLPDRNTFTLIEREVLWQKLPALLRNSSLTLNRDLKQVNVKHWKRSRPQEPDGKTAHPV